MTKARFLLAAAMLLLVGAMAFRGTLYPLPPVPAQAAAGAFDTDRALLRLQRILGDQRPHPVDSAENDAVRSRLVAELRAIGLAPRVTDGMACNGKERSMSCARVRNVLATIGPDRGAHLLVLSHYDSTRVGPGAADDGIGVAVMLEMAAILARRELRRPITFLFDEGEEAGLIGARAFLARNPIAARVDSLINLESRGVEGPALMFETSEPNAPAIARYARAVTRPAANSLSADFYRMVPNSTDVAVFDTRPWTILNFAIIGNETRYHSPGDTFAALSPRSVQHMGQQALALAADFANRGTAAEGTSLYADLLGRALIVIPLHAGVALLLLLALVHGAFCWRRRAAMERSAGAILAALAGSAAASFVGHQAVGLLRGGDFWRAYPGVTSHAVTVSALLASLAALLWIARPVPPERLRVAFWTILVLLGGLIGAFAPGALIFFLFPPLIVALGLIAGLKWKKAERAAAIAATVLLFLTMAPMLHLMEVLLDQDAAFVFAPVAAIILLPALVELKPLAVAAGRGPVLAAALALALLGWVGAALAPAYSMDRKQAFGIEYAWDATAGKGEWLIVNDGAPLPDTLSGWDFRKGKEVPWSTRARWAAPSAARPVDAPQLDRLSEERTGNSRRIAFRLNPNGAETVTIKAPPEAGFSKARVAGFTRSLEGGKATDDHVLRCHGRSCDGLRVDIETGPAPLVLTVIGTRSGLPAAAAPLLRARPDEAAPQYMPDATIALRKLRV